MSWSMSTLTDPTRPLLFLDTETTGKDPSHSHLVSLSFQLDYDGKLYCAGDFVIRPEGFEIPTSSTEIHGISHAYAMEYGADCREIISLLSGFLTGHNPLVVGHNVDFDRRVIGAEADRFCDVLSWPDLFCTMRALTPLMNLSKPKGHGPKWPTLREAYTWMFPDHPSPRWHQSRTDMLACREIFYEGRRRKIW